VTTHDDDAWLIALGAEVSDGRTIDWSAAEQRATDPATRRVVAELRRLASVMEARHGSAADPLSAGDDGPGPEEPSHAASAWRHLVTLEQVGAGAFGSVYRAWDTRLDREVALKLLRRRETAPARPPLDEARLLARVHHPNVVSVYGADEDEQDVGIWMEFIDGRTLADLVATNGPMSGREAAGVGLDLCRALAALHAAGLVHRDIKAQNVMREVGGRIVLMDFSGARGPDGTIAHEVHGTPLYMAPELFEGRGATSASEIYAVGVLLFYLLAGRHPVEGATLQDVRAAHAAGERVSLRDLRPELDDTVIQTVERATAHDPEARYRTAGDLERALLGVTGGPEATEATAGPVARTRSRLAARAALALVALALAAAAGWHANTRAPAAPLVRFALGPPYNTSSWPRVSPDGRWVVYGADADGRAVLWLRALDADEPRPLAGTEARETPFWSPDSRTLAYFATERLNRIDIDGNRAQVLAPAARPRGGSWNREGLLLFAPTPVAGLHAIRANGTGLIQVTALDTDAGEFEHSWPEFLPDGRRFLYMARNRYPDRSGIFLASLDTPGRTRVMEAHSRVAYAHTGHLLYGRAGLLVARRFDAASGVATGDEVPVASGVHSHVEGDGAFDVSPTGVLVYRPNERLRPTRLVVVDRAGKPLQEIAAPALHRHPRLSPDGQRLVVQRATSDATDPDLWLFDLQRGTASRITRHPGPDIRPAWSPDGRFIAFSSRRGRDYRVFRVLADGVENAEPLANGDEGLYVEDWARDGSGILVTLAREGLWRLPADGGPRILVRAALADGVLAEQASVSPDGRWFVYMSQESGRAEVYIEPLPPTGDRWHVSKGGGGDPQWSADGRQLYYVSDESVLTVLDVATAGTSLRLGTARPLFAVAIPDLHGPSDYAVSPDGQRFIVNAVVGDAPQALVHVAINWTALMER
jgi:eukaryotic-like serine/threonine-protein kinase